jgi:bifunctional non-homologous end joining protein LigD
MATDTSAQQVTIDGHRLKLTNLEKVMYPETGTTKGDVLAYYAAVAEVLIPHTKDRPATRKRWVHGVGTPEHPGQVFFQKNLDESTPSWVRRRTIEHSDHSNEYPLVNDLATLTWFGQIAALEIHVPQWRFGRTGARRNPDRFVLDLDPGDGATLDDCAEVAGYARSLLRGMGLDPVPVTSGSKGIHLYAALDGKQTSDEVALVAHELARSLEADHPKLVVSDMKKSLRTGRVLVDWSQNNGSKTTVAPYSLRGRFRPMVAAPRTWKEVNAGGLEQLEMNDVLRRIKRRKDPLAALDTVRASITMPSEAGGAGDRLVTYRSKRDGSKTPEPVPADVPDTSSGQSFVIQRHDARNLHYDFRLEHDGVLVSWALPKGVPTDPKQNHLAVQTEDHPLEYGAFEGTIPKGEYGAGDVEIWDAGEYELEKWRDDEVIVTLHGDPGGGLDAVEPAGPKRFALIRTSGGGSGRGGSGGSGVAGSESSHGAKQNWLIHLMKPAGTDAGSASRNSASHSSASHSSASSGSHGSGSSSSRWSSSKPTAGSGTRSVPGAVAPMLASVGSAMDIEDETEWAFEMKWDGIRAIATIERSDRIVLTSRNGKDLTPSYPEVVEALRTIQSSEAATTKASGDLVLDGEIVALDHTGRPDFSLLQRRMQLTAHADVDRERTKTPVRYLLFDVLSRNGDDLTKRTYDERRQLLEELNVEGGVVEVPPAFDGDLEAAVSSSRELGLEGIMAKERDAAYRPGRRSGSWIKIKHQRSQEVVIGGWRPGRGRRSGAVGSLLMGIPDGDGLRYAGRVGTGFRERELVELTERFAAMSRKTTPFHDVPRADASDAHWITPELVGEVSFAEWTPEHRLRQPAWRGWRTDKDPDDVVEER